MNDLLNHNGGPPLEEVKSGRRVTVRTAWAKALMADPDTPTYVMAMGWVMHWYSDADGTGAVLSNDQFASICNISRPTVTKGKEWLRRKGYVSVKIGDGRGLKSTYTLTLPKGHKEESTFPLTHALSPAKEETALPPKGETTIPETTKGEMSLQKGETTLPEKGETTLPLNQYKEPVNNQYRARTRVTTPWLSLNPYSQEAAEDCWLDGEGVIHVCNGFRTELLDELGSDEKRLDLTLRKISGNVAPGTEGLKLKMRIRQLVAGHALQKHDQDERYLKAAEANKAKAAPKKPAMRRY